MLLVMQGSWALLLGMLFLQLGNGLQGTLLGVRGELEDFSTFEMSVVMSAYFVGFLGASKLVPDLIRRVGHVRVFAALASFISAILILYPFGQSMGVDRRKGNHRFLLLWCLYYRRKLVE